MNILVNLFLIFAMDVANGQSLGSTGDSAAAPSFSWSGDTSTGLWRPAVNSIGFSTGGSERLRINSAGNLGIGVSSPSRLLQVAGAMKITPTANPGTPTAGDVFVDSTASNVLKYHNGSAWVSLTTSGGGLPAADGTVGTPSINFTNSASMGFYRIGADILGLSTAGVNRLTVDASGNVGIGTTSPSERLHVSSASGVGIRLDNQSSSNTATTQISITQSGIANVGTALRVSAQPTGDLFRTSIVNNGNEYLSVMSGGNVGIGTTAPSGRLHVRDSTGSINYFEATGANDSYTTFLSPSGKQAAIAFQSTLGTDLFAMGKQTDNSFFFWDQTNLKDVLRITTGGTMLLQPASGNVGIGTISPASLLEVAGTITVPSSAGYMLKQNGLNTGLYSEANGDISLFRTGNRGLTVSTSGNIGIGTTSPGAPLELSNTRGDNVYLRNPSAGDPWNYIGFYNNTNRRWWAGADNSGNFAITRDNAAGNILLNGGNVGIGTTNPAFPLDINAYTMGIGTKTALSGAGGNIRYRDDTGTQRYAVGILGVAAETAFSIYDVPTATSRVTVTSIGRVGIGTFSPSYKLDVVDGGGRFATGDGGTFIQRASGNTLVVRNTDNSASNLGHFVMQRGNGSGTQFILNAQGDSSNGINAADVYFGTTQVMRWTAAGNVGIGTVSPTYQLQLSTDSAAKPGTSTWTIASDERLKDIRAPFTRGLDAIHGLNTIYFNYKKDNPLDLPSEKEYVGIKAQDTQKVIPEAVSTDEQGYLHVTNDSIIWTAVNAIKELYSKFLGHDAQLAQQARSIASKADKAETEALRAENKIKDQKIKELEIKNEEMNKRLNKIEKMLNSK